jgi:hypothetical protein
LGACARGFLAFAGEYEQRRSNARNGLRRWSCGSFVPLVHRSEPGFLDQWTSSAAGLANTPMNRRGIASRDRFEDEIMSRKSFMAGDRCAKRSWLLMSIPLDVGHACHRSDVVE